MFQCSLPVVFSFTVTACVLLSRGHKDFSLILSSKSVILLLLVYIYAVHQELCECFELGQRGKFFLVWLSSQLSPVSWGKHLFPTTLQCRFLRSAACVCGSVGGLCALLRSCVCRWWAGAPLSSVLGLWPPAGRLFSRCLFIQCLGSLCLLASMWRSESAHQLQQKCLLGLWLRTWLTDNFWIKFISKNGVRNRTQWGRTGIWPSWDACSAFRVASVVCGVVDAGSCWGAVTS